MASRGRTQGRAMGPRPDCRIGVSYVYRRPLATRYSKNDGGRCSRICKCLVLYQEVEWPRLSASFSSFSYSPTILLPVCARTRGHIVGRKWKYTDNCGMTSRAPPGGTSLRARWEEPWPRRMLSRRSCSERRSKDQMSAPLVGTGYNGVEDARETTK